MLYNLLNVFEELLFLKNTLETKTSAENFNSKTIEDMRVSIIRMLDKLNELKDDAPIGLTIAGRSMITLLDKLENVDNMSYAIRTLVASGLDKVLREVSNVIMEKYGNEEFEYSPQLDPMLTSIVCYYCLERSTF